VYEYNADMRTVALLSTGTGESGAWFANADPSGSDVMVYTRQRLSTADTDNLTDLYDVRVDGGITEPVPAPPPCDGDACQGTPSAAPTFNTASGFVGLGNQRPESPAKAVKKKTKTKKKHKPKAHKRKHHRSRNHASRQAGR
jgi:hypothetical protein